MSEFYNILPGEKEQRPSGIRRMAEFVLRTFSSRAYTEHLVKNDERLRREYNVQIGAMVGRMLVEEMSEPGGYKDADLYGSLLREWQRLPEGITYREMGFSEEEIAILETKTGDPE